MNNDWLFFNVSSRRIQKRKETFHTPKISFNSSIIKTTVVKKAEPFFSQVVHYTNTNAALHGNSIFVNHTYDNHISFPTYHDPTWKDVQYFPWNDNLNYTEICKNVLKRITRNDTYYIISGSFNGGLGHKYLSVYHSITYAILLGRRFLLNLPESFWKETNSCFRHLRYYGGYKGLVVCYKGNGCNGEIFANYTELPKANLVTIDVRKDVLLYTDSNLRLLKESGIIKSLSWPEYRAVIYRLLLNPIQSVTDSVDNIMSKVPSREFAVAAHIRCAGNLAEYKEGVHMVTDRQLGYVSMLIRSGVRHNKWCSNRSVFIATDSSIALKKLSGLLYPFNVYSNKEVMRGHSTGANRNIVHFSLIDLFLLTRSKSFIGVNRSGFSKVAKDLSCPNTMKWIYV